MRLIDAERMPNDEFFKGLTDIEKAKVLQWFVSAPTVDAVEVRHGEWRFKEYSEDTYTNLTRVYECSLCGRTIECLNEADEPYCHCGAKMDG